MTKRTQHVFPAVSVGRAIAEQVWMIEPRALARLEQHALERLDESLTQHQAEQRTSWYSRRYLDEAAVLERGVAIIPIHGLIWPKMSFEVWWRDGCAHEVIREAFQAALDDGACKAILLDIDSPGGLAAGNEETSQLIYDSRQIKPIVAVASGRYAASAAYYIGSAASTFVATPSSVVGSIGAVVYHREDSELLKQLGIRFTPISSAKHKTDGNPYEPLSEQGRDSIQEYVDDSGRQFVRAVARNRGTSEQVILETYGQGKSFLAPRALAQGLVDRLATLDEILDELAGDSARPPLFVRTMGEPNDMATNEHQPAAEDKQVDQDAETQAPAPQAPVEQKPAAQPSPAPQAPVEQKPAAPPAIDPGAAARAEALEIVARCQMAGIDPTPMLQQGLTLDQVNAQLVTQLCKQRPLSADAGEKPAEPTEDEKRKAEYRANPALARQGITEDQYATILAGGELGYLDLAHKQSAHEATVQ
jgi:signal peptide peptidase SppA